MPHNEYLTALQFILKEHNNTITEDELKNEWFKKIPPSLDEIRGYMIRFAELHIRIGTQHWNIE